MRTVGRCVLAALVGFAAEAAALAPEDHGDVAAVAFSPVHLTLPVVEVQAEIYASPVVTFSVIGAYGRMHLVGEWFSAWDAGGQFRGYFVGSSQEGAYAGAEVLYVGVSGNVEGTRLFGEGLEVGGIAGYKWTWRSGFLIDLNGGFGWVTLQAESDETHEEQSQVLPILNFNIGWAF